LSLKSYCQSRNESYASANETFARVKLQERGGVATFVRKELRHDRFMFAITYMEYVAITAYLPTETLMIDEVLVNCVMSSLWGKHLSVLWNVSKWDYSGDKRYVFSITVDNKPTADKMSALHLSFV
jgi:hypothetical protein